MPYEELEYVTKRLAELEVKQRSLPATYQDTAAKIDRQITNLLEQAGVLGQVRSLEKQRDDAKTRLQRDADMLGGRIAELRTMQKRLQKTIAEMEREEQPDGDAGPGYDYPDELYGIKLAPLDDTTRLMVIQGNPETIRVLGGKVPDAPEDAPLAVIRAPASGAASSATSS